MGKALHKLGLFYFRHPVWVISFWVVLLIILGATASIFMKSPSSNISIPGTEAQVALDRMAELFPNAGKGSARIVFATENGKKISDYQEQITKSTEKFEKINGVASAIDPTVNATAVSSDGTIAYTQLQLKDGSGSLSESTIDAIKDVVASTREDGLIVEAGGDIVNQGSDDILGIGEIVGLLVALLVLVMTLGSLIAAGMPLLSAVVGVGVSMAGLFSLSQLISIDSTTPVLAVMLGLAVGIDYALFIINRYRTYLFEGYSFENAVARAIGTAGNAVVFAAATVVIALAALSVVQIPFMTSMGLAAAGAIIVAATVAITLTPALLRLAGKYILSRKKRVSVLQAQQKGAIENHHADRSTFWYKWGQFITNHPLSILVGSIVLIGVIALPAFHLSLGLPTDGNAAPSTSERKAYDLLTKGFGAGFNAPLIVVTEGLPAVSDEDRAIVRAKANEELARQMNQATAVAQAEFEAKAAAVQTPEQYAALQAEGAARAAQAEQQLEAAKKKIESSVNQYAHLVQLGKIAGIIATKEGVVSAVPALATPDGTNGLIQVIPSAGPTDATTLSLIKELRNRESMEVLIGTKSVRLSVTGAAALQRDIEDKLANALPVYLFVVVGLSFIILVVAFRSILVPLKATLGFLLSVLAMFGALVVVFQWGWFGISDAPGPIISFLPIIATGILFGLAMDYEFFLVTSMHEAYRETHDATRSIRRGFAHASRVVVAAACIMIAIFAGFIGNHDVTIKAMGFGLAVGILIDAFIVRLTIVPAVMTLLGAKAWWIPKWLDAILPHVSIEGDDTDTKLK